MLEVAASLSDEVETCLRATDELSKRVFLLSVQKHYALAAKCILKQALNGESFLFPKSLSFLCQFSKPSQFSKSNSVQGLLYVARKLPIPVKTYLLLDEFKLVQMNEFLSVQAMID